MNKQKSILIIVQNYPVPPDRRVVSEMNSLNDFGYCVSVISPAFKDQPLEENIDGVNIFRYPLPKEGTSFVEYLWEYLYSLHKIFWLTIKIRRKIGFDAIQVCNPPDFLFLIGIFHKIFGAKKFVFDHHDVCPELFALRYDPKKTSIAYKLMVLFEKWSFRTSDMSIATNESYKKVAIERGGMKPESVFVVRNGPDLDRFKPVTPNQVRKHGRDYLVAYVGVMGDQDGLDYLIRAAKHIIDVRGRKDITFALIGKGDAVEDLKLLANELNISDYVIFTGRISNEDLAEYLSTADVCAGPDPYNDFNDKCTFTKIAEYMCMSKPVVSFNLTEQKYTAQEAALYADNNNVEEFGDKIIELIDDPEKRKAMGEYGRKRVEETLSWEHSKKMLSKAYEYLFNNTGGVS